MWFSVIYNEVNRMFDFKNKLILSAGYEQKLMYNL